MLVFVSGLAKPLQYMVVSVSDSAKLLQYMVVSISDLVYRSVYTGAKIHERKY